MADASPSIHGRTVPLVGDAESRQAPRRFRMVRVFFTHKPLGVFGAVIVLVLAFFAVFGPAIAPYDPGTVFKATGAAPAEKVDCTANPYAKECLAAARGAA